MGLFPNRRTIPLENKISPTRIILLVFIFIILAGAFLLMLPVSSAKGRPTDFLTALFTSTSATCVTGLVVVDTLSYWSHFGQVVILLLIQCGGLGFMAFATVFSIVFHRRISLRERLVMTQAFSGDGLSGIVRLTKRILMRTLFFESLGVLLLAIRFVPEYGFSEGLFKSIFHAVSAFCNAGFDIIGVSSFNAGSMSKYVGDPLVCLTLSFLMISGGLGFFVWDDLLKKRRFSKSAFHTKLVIITTVSLLVGGTLLFFLFEYKNSATLGNLSFFEKLLASFFQSATTRTGGFSSFSQSSMSTSSKILSVFLMFIGGSPGSTAGGIKTVTLAVLLITSFSVMRGNTEVTAFERRIAPQTIFKAITIMIVALSLSATVSVIISLTNGTDMLDAVFESVSAISTTGLSTGITPHLNQISKIALILLMYLGRVGLLTLSIGIIARRKPAKISYPDGRPVIV